MPVTGTSPLGGIHRQCLAKLGGRLVELFHGNQFATGSAGGQAMTMEMRNAKCGMGPLRVRVPCGARVIFIPNSPFASLAPAGTGSHFAFFAFRIWNYRPEGAQDDNHGGRHGDAGAASIHFILPTSCPILHFPRMAKSSSKAPREEGSVERLARAAKPSALVDTRVIYCGDHASHYVKVLLDQIFGENNFLNEVIWKRTGARGDAKGWNQLHDTLFLYGGGEAPACNPQFENYSDHYIETKYTHDDGDGRLYRLDNMTSPNPRPNMMYEWKGHASPPKGWRYSKETMAQLDEEGRIWYPDDKSKRPQLKRYLEEMHGVPMGSVWTDIPPINSQAAERLGYPTQKPLALLDRLITASSNPNDIVLDAFCGCGTALVAAQKLKRQWIGIDISPTACRVIPAARKRASHSSRVPGS